MLVIFSSSHNWNEGDVYEYCFKLFFENSLNEKTLSNLFNEIMSFLLNQTKISQAEFKCRIKLLRGYGQKPHTHVNTFILKC